MSDTKGGSFDRNSHDTIVTTKSWGSWSDMHGRELHVKKGESVLRSFESIWKKGW